MVAVVPALLLIVLVASGASGHSPLDVCSAHIGANCGGGHDLVSSRHGGVRERGLGSLQ